MTTLPAIDPVKSFCTDAGDEPMVTLTHELIHSAATNWGGFTKAQLAVLGISYPPRHGWLRRLCGTEIPLAMWEQFLAKRGQRAKGQKRWLLVFSDGSKTITLPIGLSLKALEKRGIKVSQISVTEQGKVSSYNLQP